MWMNHGQADDRTRQRPRWPRPWRTYVNIWRNLAGLAIRLLCSSVCLASGSLQAATVHKIQNFACSPNGQHVAIERYSGNEGEDGHFRLFFYDRLTHELTDTQIDTTGRFDCLSWSADSERLAILADGLEVVECRSLRRRRLARFGLYPKMSPKGHRLIYAKELGRLMCCDPRSGKHRELNVTADANHWQWHPAGEVIACAHGNRIRLCDTETGDVDLQEDMQLVEVPDGEIQHLQFSPDGLSLWLVSAVADSESDETTLWSIDLVNMRAKTHFTFVHAYYPFVFYNDCLFYIDRRTSPAEFRGGRLLAHSFNDTTRQVLHEGPLALPAHWSESELIARRGTNELVIIDLKSKLTRRLMKLDDEYMSLSGGQEWQKGSPRRRRN